MPNMIDYIKWRSDVTFDYDPFNEVDNIILSELCYTDFAGIVPGVHVGEKVSIQDACKMFFDWHDRDEIMAQKTSLKVAPFMMEDLIQTKRFENLYLTGYINEVIEEEEFQFSVVTFILDDGSYYVAFRGTDSTIVGWKEDINMGYMYQTPGQKRAVRYLEENFADMDCKLRVGGHSKGGNLAVYASSFCNKAIQDKIINVYTNDGPGFRDQVIESEGYQRIKPKIISIVPYNSIVGMLLENDIEHKVVHSNNQGIAQHNAMSWQVLGNRFIRCDNLSESSVKLDQALTSWLADLSDDERKVFVDTLFQPVEDAGIHTIDELSDLSFAKITKIKAGLSGLSEEQHAILKDYRKKFMASAFDSFFGKKNS